jgi:non-homologous end joining protein Ku
LQKVDSKELSIGKTLVENLSTEKFDPGQYSDSYAKELEKLIEAKSKGQKVPIKEVEETAEETTDIIEALKASLKVKGKSSTSAAAKAKEKMGMAVSKIVWNRLLYTQEKTSRNYLRRMNIPEKPSH